MAEIKAVIFDLWDTLIHRGSTRQGPCKSVHKILIPEISYDEFSPRYEKVFMAKCFSTEQEGFAAVCNEFGIEPKKQLLKKLAETYEAKRKNAAMFDDSAPALKELKKRYKLALVSNTDCFTEKILKRLDIEGYFDAIVLSFEAGAVKPSPKIFRAALNKLSIKPQSALMVGDSIKSDIEGAKALGIKTVWIDRSREGKKPASADYIINSLKEIIPILKAMEGK